MDQDENNFSNEDDFLKTLEEEFNTDAGSIIKRIPADIDFISDDSGSEEHEQRAIKRKRQLSDLFSNINDEKIFYDLKIKKPQKKLKIGLNNLNQTTPNIDIENSESSMASPKRNNHGVKEQKKSLFANIEIQSKLQRLKIPSKYDVIDEINRRRKFSGIDENDYFVFAEDYDKFIGEFVSDQNLKIIRGFINTNEYNRIYYTKMRPENCEPEANVLMVHGFGHSGKYLDLGAAIARSGFEVHLFDLRGFGFSGGKRYNPRIYDIHSDIMMIIENSMNKKLPLFIYSHGFGASIIFSLLTQNNLNIAGVILSSTMISVEYIESSSYGKLKIWLIKHLGDFFRDFVINNIVNPTALTKNSFHIKRFLDDRICVPFLGLTFLSNLLYSFDLMKKEAQEFDYPMLMIHGLKDEICNWGRVEKLYNDISSKDKTKLLYKNGFHEPFLDDEAEQYKIDIISWMKERCGTAPGMGKFGKVSLGVFNTKKKKVSRRVILWALLSLVYLRGIYFLRKKELYKKNKSLMILYPIFWLYKLVSICGRFAGSFVKNFGNELVKEAKLHNFKI